MGDEPSWGWNPNRHRTYAQAGWVTDRGLLDAIVSQAKTWAAGGTVVELGCGFGHVAAAFSSVARRCIGVDHDAEMLRGALLPEQITYVHSSIDSFSHDPVDVVAVRNVLHYVRPDLLFEKAGQLLRTEGMLILCQAVAPSSRTRPWHDALHSMLSVGPAPGTDDLIGLFRRHGFRSIRSTFHFHRLNVTRWLDARTEDAALREAILRHHRELECFPEYEPDLASAEVSVTVRFVVASGLRGRA